MKKTLIIISALIALIIGGAFIYRISQPRKLVHISIDDSICLNEIDNLNSPFDHHILKKLKLFHRLYGAKFSLYSFKPDSMTNNVQIKRSLLYYTSGVNKYPIIWHAVVLHSLS